MYIYGNGRIDQQILQVGVPPTKREKRTLRQLLDRESQLSLLQDEEARF